MGSYDYTADMSKSQSSKWDDREDMGFGSFWLTVSVKNGRFGVRMGTGALGHWQPGAGLLKEGAPINPMIEVVL